MKKLLSMLTVVAVAATFATATFAEDAVAEKPAKKVKAEGQQGGEKAKTAQFTGNITAIDVAAGSVTVKHSVRDETKTFTTDPKTKVATADKAEATLADLKVGDKVLVIADESGLAKKIGPAKAAGEEKRKKEKAEKPAAE